MAQAKAANLKSIEIAQRYISTAEEFFRLGTYQNALDSFYQAFGVLEEAGVKPDPILYRSLARCHDQLGNAPEALEYYQKFLMGTEKEAARLSAPIRQARESVERLEAIINRTMIEFRVNPEKVEVRIDGIYIGTTPMEAMAVKPGERLVALKADGFEELYLDVEVTSGVTIPIVANLVPKKATAKSLQTGEQASLPLPQGEHAGGDAAVQGGVEGGMSTSRVAAIGSLGLGVGSFVGAAILFVAGRNQNEKGDDIVANPQYSHNPSYVAQAQEHYDKGAGYKTAAMVLAITGTLASGTGAYLWLSDSGPSSSPAATSSKTTRQPGPSFSLAYGAPSTLCGLTMGIGF